MPHSKAAPDRHTILAMRPATQADGKQVGKAVMRLLVSTYAKKENIHKLHTGPHTTTKDTESK